MEKIIDAAELKEIYADRTVKTTAVAEHFGVSISTLVRLLVEAGIPLRGRGNKIQKKRIRLK